MFNQFKVSDQMWGYGVIGQNAEKYCATFARLVPRRRDRWGALFAAHPSALAQTHGAQNGTLLNPHTCVYP